MRRAIIGLFIAFYIILFANSGQQRLGEEAQRQADFPRASVDRQAASCYFFPVRFLRVLTNSLISGFFFSLLLALLLADLNINLAFKLPVLFKLAIFLMLSYGLLATLLCVFVTSVYRFFTGKKSPADYISPSFLTLSFSLLTLVYLVIFRENFAYFLSFFVPGLQSILKTQMMALFILAVAGLVLHYQHHHQKPRSVYFAVFFALLGIVLAFVLWQRLNYPPPQKAFKLANFEAGKIEKRVTLLGFEGLSLDYILQLANERKLPNFSWLMEKGCWGRLKSFTPSDPFVLDHSLNTGKLPGKHRQISNVRYVIRGLGDKIEVAPRFILFRQLKRFGLLNIFRNDSPPVTKDIWKIVEDCGVATLKQGRPSSLQLPGKPNPKMDKLFSTFYKDFQYETSGTFAQVKQAFFRDAESEENAFQGRSEAQPKLFSLSLDGANVAEMFYYKYSFPEAFGDIRQEEIQKYGSVIEKYGQFYDQIIGKYLASLKEDELLIVYSAYGVEPLPFWKRIVEWVLGNAAVSSYHEQAPDGAVFFYGRGIVRGKNIDAVRLVDIAPTILYYIGLPVGKDMDGVVRGSLFDREFADENPVFTISSYEDVAIKK